MSIGKIDRSVLNGKYGSVIAFAGSADGTAVANVYLSGRSIRRTAQEFGIGTEVVERLLGLRGIAIRGLTTYARQNWTEERRRKTGPRWTPEKVASRVEKMVKTLARQREETKKSIWNAGEQKCVRCGEIKPLGEYYKCTAKPSGLDTRCKPCVSNISRRGRVRNADRIKQQKKAAYYSPRGQQKYFSSRCAAYGITTADFEGLMAAQGGKCGICGIADPRGRWSGRGVRSFHVDHDHVAGTVRGLLCSPCNRALGGFKDDPDRLARAIAYLQKPPGRKIKEPADVPERAAC